jgi:murein L,D-transpeptidase YafK
MSELLKHRRASKTIGPLRQTVIIIGGLFFMALLFPPSSPGESSPGRFIKADSVLIKKSKRRLYLLKDGKSYREYQIALGKNPSGTKLFEGDNRTPEGDYILDWRNGHSSFYKSIHISYPNESDLEFAKVVGSYAGGMIMILGIPENPIYPEWLYVEFDWTDGCIAVTNEAMDEIWACVDEGTPIRILP